MLPGWHIQTVQCPECQPIEAVERLLGPLVACRWQAAIVCVGGKVPIALPARIVMQVMRIGARDAQCCPGGASGPSSVPNVTRVRHWSGWAVHW
jgi:hypothetical protein